MEAKCLLSLSGQTPTFISSCLGAGSALTPWATDFSKQDLLDEAQINQCSLAIPGHSPQCFPQILLPELYSLPPVTPLAGEWEVVKETIISAGIPGKPSRKKEFFSQQKQTYRQAALLAKGQRGCNKVPGGCRQTRQAFGTKSHQMFWRESLHPTLVTSSWGQPEVQRVSLVEVLNDGILFLFFLQHLQHGDKKNPKTTKNKQTKRQVAEENRLQRKQAEG